MSEDKRSKLTKAAAGMIGPVLIGMFGAVMAIQIVDRFYGNETLRSFYAPETDATCWVYKLRGEQTMSCLPGDHRADEEASE